MDGGQTESRLPGIQLGRAIAALVYFHTPIALAAHGYFDQAHVHTWPFLAQRGAAGVDLFFAISGFIVCHVAARPGFTAPGFLVKRVFRIYPLNALCTLVMAALFYWRYCGTPADLDLSRLVASLLVLPQASPLNGVGWTLEYEMAFYLVAAVLIPVGGPRLLLAWCAGAAMIGAIADPMPAALARFADGHYADFGAGILAWMIAGKVDLRAPARWAVSLALAGCGLGIYLLGLHLVLAWLTPIACCLAVLGLAWLPDAPRFAVKLGDISYGLYLWHWPMIMLSPWLAYWVHAGRGSGELWRWELLALTCLVAWLSWTLLEQPINRWAARLTRSKPRVDEEPSSRALVERGELAGRQGAG